MKVFLILLNLGAGIFNLWVGLKFNKSNYIAAFISFSMVLWILTWK